MIPRLLNRKLPFYYGWLVLFSAGLSMFVRNAAGSLTLAVFVYPMETDLGWSRTEIAGAASLGGLLSIIGAPVTGWACDKFGVRWVLVIGVLLLGITTLSLSWATLLVTFYAAFGFARLLFTGPIPIGASVVVSRWFVRMRGRANGILFFCHAVGMAVFPYVAFMFIQSRGWQDAWVLLGVMVWIFALLPVLLFIRQNPESVGLLPDGERANALENSLQAQKPEEPMWSLRQALGAPSLWLLAIATGLLYLIQSGTNMHQGAYFIDQGLSVKISALAVSGSGVMAGLGTLGWGWLVEKIPVRFAFMGVGLVVAVAIGLFPQADTAIEALAYAGLFGVGVAGMLVVPPVAYANYFGRGSLGAIRGVTETLVALGQAIGAVLSGYIFDVTGTYLAAFYGFAVVGVITIVLLMLATPPKDNSNFIPAL